MNVTQQNLFADSRNTDNRSTNKTARQAPQLEQLTVQGQTVYVCHSQSVSVVYSATTISGEYCLGSAWVEKGQWKLLHYDPDCKLGREPEVGATSLKTTIAKLMGQQSAQINDDRWTQVAPQQASTLKEVA